MEIDWTGIALLVTSLGTATAAIITAFRVNRVQKNVVTLQAKVENAAADSEQRTRKIDVIGEAVAAAQRQVDKVETNTNSITERLGEAKLSEGTALGTAIGRKEIVAEQKIEAREGGKK